MVEIRIPDLNEAENYRQYSALLYRKCYRAIGNKHNAEDLTQICLEKVIKSQHRYDGRASFETWLNSIAANVIRDHLRKKRLEKAAFLQTSSDRILSGETHTTPQDEVIGRETERRLNAFLANYGNQETVETWALDLEELSDLEISRRQDISVKSVKSRLHRIRREASEYLDINHGFYHR